MRLLFSLPTLFLSECVLIYIEPRDSDAIVNWVGANMAVSLFVVYEQINPTDAFGAMMLRNLKVSRNSELHVREGLNKMILLVSKPSTPSNIGASY